MATVTNISSNTIVITAMGTERHHTAPNFRLTLAASAQSVIPDDIMRLERMQALVTAADLRVDSWDTSDDSSVNQAELKALIAIGTGTLTAGTTTTVADTRVKTDSKIYIMPLDTAFAALAVWHDASELATGVSFELDHASASGGEAFDYLIIDNSHA